MTDPNLAGGPVLRILSAKNICEICILLQRCNVVEQQLLVFFGEHQNIRHSKQRNKGETKALYLCVKFSAFCQTWIFHSQSFRR